MISRRKCLVSAATALPIAATWPRSSWAQQKSFTYSGSGGVVSDVERSVYLQPFGGATGMKVDYVSTEAQRMAQLEAMVRAGRTSWDVMEISATDYPLGVKKGLFEAIDYSKADPTNVLPPMARLSHGVGAAAFSTVMVVRRDKQPTGKSMASWADFWDVKTFPGPRTLRGRPQYNLEFALLAEGVAAKDLYKVLATKEGVDRAFKKLEVIKPHIAKWWVSGAESVQLLNDGEAFFGTTYNGRVGKLQSSGIPAEIVWNGSAMHLTLVGIPKGAKNLADSHEYVRIRTTQPIPMRKYIEQLPYPGFAPRLYEGMKEDLIRTFPTYPKNVAVQFNSDESFWSDNLDKIEERWNEWLLKK